MRCRFRSLPSATASCACLLAAAPLLACPPALHAQGRAASRPALVRLAGADTALLLSFDVPAQPLPEALGDFSRQAGVRVLYDGAAVAAARSSAVSGRLTAAEALRRLLQGSGFRPRFVGPASVEVVPEGGRDSTPQRLRHVVVTGSATGRAGYGVPRTSSAMRTDTPLRDAPQAVTVVTRALIADQGMQGMADVVRYVPGVSMGQGEGHRDAPTIRGNSSTADFFVDGVRDDAQYYRDLYNVERVEALKGPNAMVFGRGGGGGVLNRVSKEARWAPAREVTLAGGSFEHRRATVDVGQGLGRLAAVRLNGLYENSGGFRDAAAVTRYGINPTATIAAGGRTTLRLGYELFDDRRTVDRGIPSFQGRPSAAAITTFFGDPDASLARARVHAADATLDHVTTAGLELRNRTRFVRYDKFYQNVFPGAVDAAGERVSIAAYNNGTLRDNLFNQTDLTYRRATGAVQHTLLLGAELGRQATDNVRQTGYFGDGATSTTVPFDQPTIAAPVTFRQSATDADNGVVATVAALYAQDQVALSEHVQAVVGLRYERFDLAFHDDRSGQDLERADVLLSPRAGLVVKPVASLSLYGGYGVSHLPSSGDQFASLTATTRTLEPERFANYEVGAKWDVRPDLSLTTAAYRLDRTNSTAKDPTDPARTVQTGSQRTTGYEVGATGNLTGAWQVAGGFATQRAVVTSTTTAAATGARVPLVPRYSASLWNRYQVARAWGVGLGVIHQADMYAAIDDAVTLPGFTRLDGALFLALGPQLRAQVNVENLLDERYYATSHGNNNIMPGAPRTVRLTLTSGF